MLEGWLTLHDAAARFGVKRDRLKRASWQGRLTTRKVGTGAKDQVMVKPDEVERFVRESRRGRPRRVTPPAPEAPTSPASS